jgi:hypothetical protein
MPLLGKGKCLLVEDDMTRDDDSIGSEVKAAVLFVMSRIANEDAKNRQWSEFMAGYGGEIRVTLAPKNAEMSIRRQGATKSIMRRTELKCLGGQDVDQVCGGGKSFSPVGGRHASLK